ncbi:MAG: hypothetical protein ACE5GX_06475 [Thermoanaerobaculia bacterium]
MNRVIQVTPDPQSAAASCVRLRQALIPLVDGSIDNPYIVNLESGEYDCGTSTVIVPEGVCLQGMGHWSLTRIIAHVDHESLGAIHLLRGSQLRNVEVINFSSDSTPENGGIVVSLFDPGSSVDQIEIYGVNLSPAANPPNNYSIEANGAFLRVVRSQLFNTVHANGSIIGIRDSVIQDTFVEGGSQLRCSFTRFVDGTQATQSCQMPPP